MSRRLAYFLLTLTLVTIGYQTFVVTPASGGAPSECTIDVASGSFGGTQGAKSSGACGVVQNGGGTLISNQPIKIILCGRPSSADNGIWNPRCGAQRVCFDTKTEPGKKIAEDAYATLVLSGNTWVLQSVWCPATAEPIPTTEALREQALRLLPRIQIGSAWAHRALVNAQTVLWAATDPDRALPTATVVGRRVGLRISFDHATWNFGDGGTETTTEPGKAYDKVNDPCPTARCPDYYGHTYTATGPVTVSLTVAWHAEFSLDNGTTWTAIDPGALTGPATTHDLVILQARGVLVPDPGH